MLKYCKLFDILHKYISFPIFYVFMNSGGKFWNHSMKEFNWFEKRLILLVIILFQIINKKNKILTNERVDPIDDTIFHEV